MKRILSILFLAVFSINTVAAGDTAISPSVLQSFQKTFSHAKEVNWTVTREVYKADFVYSNQYITAFYEADGNLIGLTKNILSTQLPMLLENSLKENYADYWITDLLEFSNEEETVYYVTIENGDQKMILRSYSNNWSVSKKIKK